jgi:uncharacterized protein (TIGR02453 family)
MAFSGWPAAAFEFYAGLETDNSRSYWQAHRDVYEASVKEPFLALSDAVEREFGALRMFRPNRDTRFAKDKSPYKTAAAAVTEGPGGTHYYVMIGVDGLYAGSGYYMFTPDQLDRWRAAVADDRTGKTIERAVSDLRAQRYEVAPHDALKTAPRGYPRDHPRVELLRWKGCHAGRSFGTPKWVSSPRALDRIVETWRAAASMNRWLDKQVGPSTMAPPTPD